MTDTIEHVSSADGTRSAYRRLGAGPRIVVLHGALGTSLSWLAVAKRLTRGQIRQGEGHRTARRANGMLVGWAA